MSLSGQQRKKLQAALIDAFPTSASLEQMLLHELDKSLKVIAGEGSLQDIVFNLIKIAEAEGWVEDLIRAARASNSGNPKLLTIAQELLPGSATTLSPQQQKNRRDLFNQVKDEVKLRLKDSLHNAVLIELGKESQPERVKRPWDTEVRIGVKPPKPIPDTTKIIDVFTDSVGKLLILGEPGSGKTTTQLELAQALIEKAEKEPDYPIPVLLNLSSWQDERQSITEWLIAELKSKYGVSKSLGQEWLQNRQLLPLLDGLDEVKQVLQESCINSINQFLQGECSPQYLVVCSRSEEYRNHSAKLSLNGAIYLHPLTDNQIRDYLNEINYTDLQRTIENDLILLELIRTPFLLSVSILAFQEISIDSWQRLTSTEDRIQHLLDAYVIRMLKKEINHIAYGNQKSPSDNQTRLWLVWLAKQMQRESKTEFLIEDMQPEVLPMGKKRKYRWLFGLNFLLFFEMIFGLFFGLLGGLSHETGLLFGLIGGLCIAPFFAFICGMLCVFATVFKGFNFVSMNIEVVEKIKWSWQEAKTALFFGLYFGLFIGLLLGFIEKAGEKKIDLIYEFTNNFPLVFAGSMGSILGIFLAHVEGLSLIEAKTTVTTQRFWILAKKFLHGGVIFGLMYWLFLELVVELNGWMFFGMLCGLFFGITCASSIFCEKVEDEFFGKINWSLQKVEAKTKGWLIFLQIFGLLSALLNVVLGRVSIELFKLTSTFLIHGVKVGFVSGVIFGLIWGLFSGLHTIEDVEKKLPNQGIWNSTKNLVRVGLIYGLIYGLLSVPLGHLIVELFKLGSLSMGQKLANGLMIGLVGGLVHGLLKGGLAGIQHFTLRLLLYFNGYIPWNYARFLDYGKERSFLQRVGGRYRFIHKMVQDHFANMEFKRD